MTISINTLNTAITARRGLQISQPEFLKGLKNISTGLRINTPADDVAGSFIVERLNARIQGFDQGFRNANDGISVLRTANSALETANEAVLRIREIAVLASNATTDADTRQALQSEVTGLVESITKLSKETKFNENLLLDGSYFGKFFQTGADRGDNIEVSIQTIDPGALGAEVNIAEPIDVDFFDYELTALNPFLFRGTAGSTAATGGKNPNDNNVIRSQTLLIQGAEGNANVNVANFDSALAIANKINTQTTNTGVSATAITQVRLSNFTQTGGFDMNVAVNGGSLQNIAANIISTSNLTSVLNAINAESGTTGITATFGANTAELILTNSEGRNIVIDDLDFANGSGRADVNPVGTSSVVTLGQSNSDSVVVSGRIKFESEDNFSVTSTVTDNADNILANVNSGVQVNAVSIPDNDPPEEPAPIFAFQSLIDIDVTSQTGAIDAIEIADGAIDSINLRRSHLGSLEQRFELAASDLQSGAENLVGARGKIEDADFAKESARVARGLVLQEIGISLLAQANAVPELALNLLLIN